MSYPQYPAAPAYPPPPGQQPPSYSPGHPSPQPGPPPPGAYAGQPGHAGQPTQQAYPTQQGYPAQQTYPGQQVYPGQAYPAGQPGTQAAFGPQLQCRFCGSVPAVQTTFRGHQGMLVIMRFLSMPGPYCRDCGLATFREMTAKTLVQGWWGYISFVVTPFTVLWNLIVSRKVRNLAPPTPTRQQRPMDPGPGLLMRPMTIIGLAIPLALFILLVIIIVAGS
ncbi:hypothetical protein ACFO0M_18720 [Micromonospora mangrovi]|uniref:Toxin-antitoxin system, toxin component n=2 Tax=Micromonospora TaxID=1873 RepID=A0AAU8HBB8_9ACTN